MQERRENTYIYTYIHTYIHTCVSLFHIIYPQPRAAADQQRLQFRGQFPELEAMMDTALEGMRAAMTEPLAPLKAAPVAEAPSGGGGALRPRGSPGHLQVGLL